MESEIPIYILKPVIVVYYFLLFFMKLIFSKIVLAEICHESSHPTLFFFFGKTIYLLLAALGLYCCARAFSSCGEQRLLSAQVCRLLIAVSPLVVVVNLLAPEACGIFLDQKDHSL